MSVEVSAGGVPDLRLRGGQRIGLTRSAGDFPFCGATGQRVAPLAPAVAPADGADSRPISPVPAPAGEGEEDAPFSMFAAPLAPRPDGGDTPAPLAALAGRCDHSARGPAWGVWPLLSPDVGGVGRSSPHLSNPILTTFHRLFFKPFFHRFFWCFTDLLLFSDDRRKRLKNASGKPLPAKLCDLIDLISFFRKLLE